MTVSAVNGYYAPPAPPQPLAVPPAAPPPPPAPPAPMPMAGANTAWPTPVVVPVNTAPNYNTSSVDQYVQTATQFAPYVAGAIPGRAAASKVSEAKSFFLKASKSKSAATSARASQAGRSAMFGSIMSAVKSSVLINGIISVAINGYKLATGKETTAQAGAEVTGDLMSAAVGGAAGGVASAAGTFLLAGILGTGLPLTLAGMACGVVGYMVADGLLKQTSFYTNIKNKVSQMLS